MERALILFAHGAREPSWAEPFEALSARVRALAPETPVRLAFLELMKPDLAAAVDELGGEGVDSIRIVPIFLGQGGHLQRDLPQLVAALRGKYPTMTFTVAPPAGEDHDVLDAIAAYCLRDRRA